MSRIYLASSWRNESQPQIVEILRAAGQEVYDFRNPPRGQSGFGWSEIDPNWRNWSIDKYWEILLTHPRAKEGFLNDYAGMNWADTCVLLLPSGRSAHLEAGYMMGQKKRVFILLHQNKFEPELMYLLADIPEYGAIVTSIEELLEELGK